MHPRSSCPGPAPLSRRRLLQLGGGALGLTLGGVLRAQVGQADSARPAPPPRIRSCILVFYYGGPSHLDTFDLKPNAPAEVRGEFRPVATSVPGTRICEHLPRLGRLMHKVALVRSMHHANRLHDSASTEALTGRPSPNGDREEFAPIKQFFPCYGATLHYLRRDRRAAVPHAVLPFIFHNVVDVPCQGGGFLGSAYDPLVINADPATRSYHAGALSAAAGLPLARVGQRQSLLGALERRPDPTSQRKRVQERALELLHSRALREALDLSREPARVRERYGFGAPSSGGGGGAENGVGREMRGQSLLLARRLVEAGVPFVNVNDFRQQGQNWDAHAKGFAQHKDHLLPPADQALSALIEDLDARGLLDTTLVVAMGEFGRTPKINRDAGRDHWPDCYTVLLAGGGVKGGYVHGSSDRLGAYPATEPVTPADMAATVYSRFGIDPATEVHDPIGRPFKVADGRPISRLFDRP